MSTGRITYYEFGLDWISIPNILLKCGYGGTIYKNYQFIYIDYHHYHP